MLTPLKGISATLAWAEGSTTKLQIIVLCLPVTLEAIALANSWMASKEVSGIKADARAIFLNLCLRSLGTLLPVAIRSDVQKALSADK